MESKWTYSPIEPLIYLFICHEEPSVKISRVFLPWPSFIVPEGGRKKVASAKRKGWSNFNSKYAFFFPLFFRLTESHRKAIRVIQRMRYLVAKRNFQVSPDLSGEIWCSVLKATCWGNMKHRLDISMWSSTRSGWCGVWFEFQPIFIDLLCCRVGSSNQMLTSLATQREALSTYGETNSLVHSEDFFIWATDLLICVHAAFIAG